MNLIHAGRTTPSVHARVTGLFSLVVVILKEGVRVSGGGEVFPTGRNTLPGLGSVANQNSCTPVMTLHSGPSGMLQDRRSQRSPALQSSRNGARQVLPTLFHVRAQRSAQPYNPVARWR